jgi:hypothetical protein
MKLPSITSGDIFNCGDKQVYFIAINANLAGQDVFENKYGEKLVFLYMYKYTYKPFFELGSCLAVHGGLLSQIKEASDRNDIICVGRLAQLKIKNNKTTDEVI